MCPLVRWPLVVALIFSPFYAHAQSTNDILDAQQVIEKAQRYRAERQARARALSMIVPLPTLLDQEAASLVLVSTVDHLLDFEVSSSARRGRSRPWAAGTSSRAPISICRSVSSPDLGHPYAGLES